MEQKQNFIKDTTWHIYAKNAFSEFNFAKVGFLLIGPGGPGQDDSGRLEFSGLEGEEKRSNNIAIRPLVERPDLAR